MMTTDNTYQNQRELYENIQKVGINTKKDGWDRKNSEYFKRRMQMLEKLWSEFQFNHDRLSTEASVSHPYFTSDLYHTTLQCYKDVKELILQQHQQLATYQQPATGRPAQPTQLRETSQQEEAGTSSKYGQDQELQNSEDEDTTGTSYENNNNDNSTQSHPQQQQNANKRDTGSSSKLDDLLRKQSANFKAFMRAVNNINVEFIQEKWEFQDALQTLQTRWSAIENLNLDIECELNGDINKLYEERFTRFENQFIDLKKALNTKMWAGAYRERTTPTLEIPMFHGKFNQWIPFKDLFTEAIHNNTALSNAQKMQFLKSKVQGEAERLILHLPISSNNYLVCWNILNERYNNKKLIFTSYINMLFTLPTMQQQSSTPIKRIHDVTIECLHAIKNLGVDVKTWDPLLVHILSQKLDVDTYSDYVGSLKNTRELPLLKDFLDYLEAKFTSMESSQRKQEGGQRSNIGNQLQEASHNKKQNNYFKKSQAPYNNKFTKSYHASSFICPLCNEEHGLYFCAKFLEMNEVDKLKTTKKLQVCINCLYSHKGKKCTSKHRCRKCQAKHNTLMHDAVTKNSEQNETSSSSHASQSKEVAEILLATAMLKVQGADGTQFDMRALVDQGSQVSLITERAAQLLGIKRQKAKGVVSGVGEKESSCKGMITISCQSVLNNFTFRKSVYIMKNLVKNLPNKSFSKPSWPQLQNIQLADPNFNNSRPVDLLLGADVYSLIMLEGIIKSEDVTQPIAQQTHLGWLLCGHVRTLQCNMILNNIEDMSQFWGAEDIYDQDELSVEDQRCVENYNTTTKRLKNGRYEVRLPMKNGWESKLGTSKQIAIAQFKTLERKLEKQKQLAKAYKEFIAEYIDLGHMHQISCNKTLDCYLPHHGIERAESSTTKYRVVFNASAKTSTGWSLNDLMDKGPNLQQDLQTILIKWRQYKYAYTADIEKMYRQILVAQCDQNLQKIIWRESSDKPLRSYQLATVTYGTKAAPFLAIMTLRRLAEDESKRFPEASIALRESFYVDDLVHGSQTIEQGQTLISDLIQLLKNGGFNLRKWSTNEPIILGNLTQNNKESIQHNNTVFNFKTDQTSKTLGLCWNAKEDEFTFQYSISEVNKIQTKRSLLAEISKLFDPLGWLAPLSTKLKLLFQKLWEVNLQWDEKVPHSINQEWWKIQSDIKTINLCKVPRWLKSDGKHVIELHGFSDASQDAYACVIYARSDPSKVTLVAAKSKIVPHKRVTTLPRLELNGALLLSKLMQKVRESLQQLDIRVYGWTDSMVVLSWIQGDPSRWKTYVENRVQKINAVIPRTCWYYVKSNENPADAASRGQYAGQLKENKLWWQGPTWLPSLDMSQQLKHIYTSNQDEKTNIPKQGNTAQLNTVSSNIIEQLLQKHSSMNHIIRIVAWLQRAMNLILRTLNRKHHTKQLPSYLTLQELKTAIKTIVKQTQYKLFESDISHLRKHGTVASNSKLLPLNPYIDQDGVLRVGGRLKNASISEDMKHPMIIPYNSQLTHLLIDQAHLMTFHGGPRLTLSHLRQQYWIIGGVRATKMQVRRCVTCRKISPTKQQQLMGDLPSARTNPAPPFYHTGVDYTGFVDVKMNKGRGAKTTKGYIAIFICMVTKAVHIELVSDLTSSAFLAALNRMAARRGAPHHLYSDNGTNFVGANRLLLEQYGLIEDIYRNDDLQRHVAEMHIQWHFNAPAWPSAGGLWERAVRSLKHHLKRVVGDQKLTFEEFATILTKLEACLNSRPLCALSENIEDLDCLTPAHFLTGRPGLTIIETREDARTRWELTRKLYTEIWKKWKGEYLAQLLARTKWLKPQENVKIGDMVVIHDDQQPAGKWSMGRVIDLHPGDDGYVRVVTLKTRTGLLKRPITKLSTLPLKSDETSTPQNTDNKQQKHVKVADTGNNKQPRNKANFVGLVMILLYLLSPATATRNTTNVIELQQGLYFDKSSNMKLIRDEWKIVVYYDITPYWHGTTVFTKFIEHLEIICSKLNQKAQCEIILLQLHNEFAELAHYNRILLNPQGRLNMRHKRGLINAVGSIARSLFGVLDDQFAEQYQRDIENIRQNEKYLALLYKNQTTIIEAEYNLIKRSEETIEKQYKIFNRHLLNLDNLTSKLQQEIEAQALSIEFVMSAVSANSFIEHIRNVQDMLLDTVTNIYNGKMNLHLIAPEQFQDELNIISGQLLKDVTLPINNIQEDYFRLYHLLKVKAKMTEKYLIIEIRVPLVSRENYEIFHIIPVPVRNGNNMVTLLPIAEMVAINIQKNSYLPMAITDLHECIQYDSITLLCHIRTPLYHIKSDENLCLKNKTSPNCKTKQDSCKNMWLELNNINNYIYFCCDACKIRVVCGNQVSTRVLVNSGIISLETDCIINSESFTVYSQKRMMNTITAQVEEVTMIIPPINQIINLSVPVSKQPETEPIKEQKMLLGDLGQQIEQMKAAATGDIISDRATYHDVHQYVVIYLLAGIATIVGAIYVYIRIRKHFTSQQKPEAPPVGNPVPRRRSTANIVMDNVISDVINESSSARTLNKATSPAPIACCDLS